MPPETQTPQAPLSPLGQISTSNPALKGLFDNANTLLTDFTAKGGQLTPEIANRIKQINDFETTKLSAVAGARSAADIGKPAELDTGIKTAQEAEQGQQNTINELLAELKNARTGFVDNLAMTGTEKDLKSRLNTLRTERKLMPIELRQEGISAGGIEGRTIEDERVRTIQESNLLAEIGLEQEARKMKGEAIENQINFIKDDIELQNKIQENLTAQENKILEQARNMRKDSISAMSDIIDSFKGLAFTDLDVESQSEILNTAKQFGIPPVLLAEAMANAKRQQVFDNALKFTSGQSTAGLSSKQQTIVNNVSTQFQNAPITKLFNEVLNKKSGIDLIIQNGVGGPADLALVFEFMKGLDPTSVVRETEYETAAKSGNIFKGAFAKFNGYFKDEGGFLPDNVKKQFQNLVNQKYSAAEKQYDNLRDQSAKQINKRAGVEDGEDYLIDYKIPSGDNLSLSELPPIDGAEESVDNSGFFGNVLKLWQP
jgi:hypothetical protein